MSLLSGDSSEVEGFTGETHILVVALEVVRAEDSPSSHHSPLALEYLGRGDKWGPQPRKVSSGFCSC